MLIPRLLLRVEKYCSHFFKNIFPFLNKIQHMSTLNKTIYCLKLEIDDRATRDSHRKISGKEQPVLLSSLSHTQNQSSKSTNLNCTRIQHEPKLYKNTTRT